MKAATLSILLLGIFLIQPLDAQIRRIKNSKSNLDFSVTNKGILFSNDNTAGLHWPRGSNDGYIFGGGFWFGAKKYVAPVPGAEPWSEAGGINDSLISICGNPITKTLLVGTFKGGVYERSSIDQTWTQLPFAKKAICRTIVTLPTGDELIGSDSGLFIGKDNGPWVLAPGTETEQVLALSGYGAINTSRKKAHSYSILIPDSNYKQWKYCRTTTSMTSGYFLCIGSSKDNRIIAASTSLFLIISTDFGNTWDSVATPSNSRVRGVGISPIDGSIFIASNSIYQSYDKGQTWVERKAGLIDPIIIDFKIGTSGFVVATSSGIYTLPNDSMVTGSWIDHTKGLPKVRLVGIDLDPSGKLHVVLENHALYTQYTGGEFQIGIKKCCELSYNPSTGAGWFSPGESGNVKEFADTLGKYFSYMSTSFSRITGAPIITDSATPPYRWPVWTSSEGTQKLRSNFRFGSRISSVSDRDAQPQLGAKPVFISGEDILNTYTDTDVTANPEFDSTDGLYPLGLTVNESIYSWQFGRYRDLIYIRYEIKNCSSDTLRDCFFAPAFDPDLGIDAAAGGNDFCSSITSADSILVKNALGSNALNASYVSDPARLNMAYQWSKQESGKEYGALAFAFVETPIATSGKIIQSNDSSGLGGYGPNSLYSNNNLGLNTFHRWTISNDPTTASTRYSFISSGIKDHVPGTGADVRVIFSTGPFDLMPDELMASTIAIGVAHPSSSVQQMNIDSLISLMAFAHRFFAHEISQSGDSNAILIRHFEANPDEGVHSADAISSTDLSIYPNPLSLAGLLHYTLNERSQVSISLYDELGRTVLQPIVNKIQEKGRHDLSIDVSMFPNGHYSCTVFVNKQPHVIQLVLSK